MAIYCTPHNGQNGSATVHSLLEFALRTEYGEKLPEIKKTPHGKPYFPGMPDVHFSLSHSKTHVLCVVSGSPVGCDIESPRVISSRTLEYFSSPEELVMFKPLDLWVLKESYIKLFGQTIAAIRNLRFSLDGERIILPDSSVTARLYHVGEFCAAVCSLGPNPPDSIVLI